jgi:hypothetical protein
MTDKHELLPCPFCGGEGEMSFAATAKTPEPAFRMVECIDCSSTGESFADGDFDDGEVGAKIAAQAAWNTRPQPTQSSALADELERDLQTLGPALEAIANGEQVLLSEAQQPAINRIVGLIANDALRSQTPTEGLAGELPEVGEANSLIEAALSHDVEPVAWMYKPRGGLDPWNNKPFVQFERKEMTGIFHRNFWKETPLYKGHPPDIAAAYEKAAQVADSWMENSALTGDMATYAAQQTGGDIAKAIRSLAEGE